MKKKHLGQAIKQLPETKQDLKKPEKQEILEKPDILKDFNIICNYKNRTLNLELQINGYQYYGVFHDYYTVKKTYYYQDKYGMQGKMEDYEISMNIEMAEACIKQDCYKLIISNNQYQILFTEMGIKPYPEIILYKR